MPGICFLNGQFVMPEEAKISVNDRGFQFGDGVYEVIRTYRGRIFHLEEHLKRFQKSASEIELPFPSPLLEIKSWIEEAYQRSQFPEAKIYIQLTRGMAERSHAFPAGIKPTFLITVLKLHPLPPDMKETGVEMITTEDLRWGRCDIKSLNLLANVLAQQKAKKAGVFEALMIRDHKVTEGSISNFFMIKNDFLITPPLSQWILAGVTRDLILYLARSLKVSTQEREIQIKEIYQSDEVFISGTTIEIVPVVKIDGKKISKGRPGTLTQSLMKQFQSLTES